MLVLVLLLVLLLLLLLLVLLLMMMMMMTTVMRVMMMMMMMLLLTSATRRRSSAGGPTSASEMRVVKFTVSRWWRRRRQRPRRNTRGSASDQSTRRALARHTVRCTSHTGGTRRKDQRAGRRTRDKRVVGRIGSSGPRSRNACSSSSSTRAGGQKTPSEKHALRFHPFPRWKSASVAGRRPRIRNNFSTGGGVCRAYAPLSGRRRDARIAAMRSPTPRTCA